MQVLQQNEIGSKRLTGSALKWIAMALMVIDHIGAFIVQPCIVEQQTTPEWLAVLYMSLRVLGRLAFPIFCFLLVEGFFHTHDRRKYLLQLAVFAVLSDPAFDFAIAGRWFDFSTQNVFFTLALGLLAVWCVDTFTTKAQPVLGWCGVVLFCATAQLCHTDYSFLGVALILTFYLCRGKKSLYFAIPLVMFIGDFVLATLFYYDYVAAYGLVLVLENSLDNAIQETIGALTLVFVSQYNGQRGGKLPKYFFYAFYPVHMLLLAGVRFLLLGQ